MTVELKASHLKSIKTHGEETYPHECCGFLLGSAHQGRKEILVVQPASNSRGGDDRHNRYLIAPEEFLQVEKAARSKGLDVVGIYHSHPDVEARPSAYDMENAWPWYVYLIVSVKKKKADHVRAWVLADDRSQFSEHELIVRAAKGD